MFCRWGFPRCQLSLRPIQLAAASGPHPNRENAILELSNWKLLKCALTAKLPHRKTLSCLIRAVYSPISYIPLVLMVCCRLYSLPNVTKIAHWLTMATLVDSFTTFHNPEVVVVGCPMAGYMQKKQPLDSGPVELEFRRLLAFIFVWIWCWHLVLILGMVPVVLHLFIHQC